MRTKLFHVTPYHLSFIYLFLSPFYSTLSDYSLSLCFSFSTTRPLSLCLSLFSHSHFSIFAHGEKWNLAFVLFIDAQTMHFTSLIMFLVIVNSLYYYYNFQHLNLRHNIFFYKSLTFKPFTVAKVGTAQSTVCKKLPLPYLSHGGT